MARGSIISKVFKLNKLKKRDYNPNLVDIKDITMPTIFNSMDMSITNMEAKSELKSHKSLCYRFRTLSELEVYEYHSYQIGILLNAIKLNIDLKIEKPNDFFINDIIKLDKHTIAGKVSELIKKYNTRVKKAASANILKKDLIFTPIDAAYLLYYLSFYLEL